MKITCTNCKKSYNINVAKVPLKVKAAKCKSCGHLIPLRRAASEQPAIKTRTIEASCRYCGKTYTLRSNKIPTGAASFRCKSCRHPVPLKQKPLQPPVHPLKKESLPLPSEKPEIKAQEPYSSQDDTVRISCPGCRKKYKFRQNSIPPNAIAVNCRICGHKISLPSPPATKAAESRVPPEKRQPEKTPLKSISKDIPQPIDKSRKKSRLLAAAVGVMLVVILGIFAGSKFLNSERLNQIIPRTAEETAERSALLEKEPFLVFNLNVPLILNSVENRIQKDKSSIQFQKTAAILKSLNLERLEVYLYAGAEHRIFPVILTQGGNRKYLEKIFDNEEPFNKYFERTSDSTYRFKIETLGDSKKFKFPDEPYQLTLIEQEAVFAPVNFSAAILQDRGLLRHTQAARLAKSVEAPQTLAVAAVRIPEGIQKGWEKKIQDHPAVDAIPQVAMVAGMGAGIMSQLSGSLKPVDSLALAFRLSGNDGRALSYAQQFRVGVDGRAIYRKLKSRNLQGVVDSGIIGKLIELLQNRRYDHRLQFKDNRLIVEFNWSKKDDEVFLAALTEATIGQLIAESIKLNPTEGPVETRYTEEPHLVTTVDVDTLKPKIPQIIKQRLFPGHFWNFGETPQMTLDLDTVDIPNAAMAELEYETSSIRSPDGEDVLRIGESKFKTIINPGSMFPGSLSLSIKKETPPEALGAAKIRFHLSLPVALEVFEWKAGAEKGSVITADGIRITLDRLEKDVAQISYIGGETARLFAYDQTGKTLASKETMNSASSVSTRFQGVIDTLKVVVADKMLEFPFEVEVDLNAGKELTLSQKPEIPKRIRYNHKLLPMYVDLTERDLDNLTVVWKEAADSAWNDNLFIQLPKGPFNGHAIWEIHFFGKNKPQLLTGNPIQGMRDFSFRLDKGKLKNSSAAFGKVQLDIKTGIKRLRFFNNNNGETESHRLPTGDNVHVSFNKNEITYSAGRADMIQTSAYDATGRRLKQDNYARTKGDKRKIYFWGSPARFDLDVATKTLKRQIVFDVRQRPLDEQAYQAFKQTIENQREIVTTLKTMDRARRRDLSYYGDDLAGLYYLYDRNKKKPMQLIDKNIAHSDPVGQKRFRYKVKPYRGYYFSVLSGVQANSVNQEYKRRPNKSEFIWQKGTIKTNALTRHPDLVAIPEDKSQPTFFLQWGQVYMKPLYGVELNYLPENFSSKGWSEALFVGSDAAFK